METKIDKDILKKSIELTSKLNLNKQDLDRILEKFGEKLYTKKVEEKILERFNEVGESEDIDFEKIMKILSNKLSSEELNTLLSEFIKNEELTDFIQDLFIEKLL